MLNLNKSNIEEIIQAAKAEQIKESAALEEKEAALELLIAARRLLVVRLKKEILGR